MDIAEDSPIRKPIETIQESGNKAVAIVQDLLTIARGVASPKKPLNLNHIVKDYLASPEFKELERRSPLARVQTCLDEDLFHIEGSLVHIRKVVMNLVSNALEAIQGGGNIVISTFNRFVDKPVRGYEDVNIGEYAVLAVSDDGTGIPSRDLEKIFEPFFTKKKMGRSGTGLGLAVVWNVVQDHTGYVDVRSEKTGTKFELYFPITRGRVLDEDLSGSIEDLKGRGETVLIIDDMAGQRDISGSMLEVLDYKGVTVSSGEEAIEYLKNNQVDLVLLDMIMDPGMGGLETYEKIIKIRPGQKAIIVSGFAESEDVKAAQKLGAGQYIKKPLTVMALGTALKKELAN
jgi:CheY-like chemotaxis protein